MKFSLGFLKVAVLALFSSGLPAHAAETNASIPYKGLNQMCEAADTVNSSNVILRVFISSTNKTVHPSDIKLTIQSKSKGAIPVQIGTNGLISNFPHDKALLKENPSVISNQPKGSLRTSVNMLFPIQDQPTFRYARIKDDADEINKLIKEQAGLLSLIAPKVKGLYFHFPRESAGKAKIAIESASGRKEFVADKDGEIEIAVDKKLLAENPEVKVSEKPQWIEPDMD